MAGLTKETAYLIKNGVPYDRALAMTPDELKAAVRTMQKVERQSPVGRMMTVIGGLLLIFFGVVGLALLAGLAGLASH